MNKNQQLNHLSEVSKELTKRLREDKDFLNFSEEDIKKIRIRLEREWEEIENRKKIDWEELERTYITI